MERPTTEDEAVILREEDVEFTVENARCPTIEDEVVVLREENIEPIVEAVRRPTIEDEVVRLREDGACRAGDDSAATGGWKQPFSRRLAHRQ